MRLVAIGLALALSGAATAALAAPPCPPEVAEAKTALSKTQASLKKATAAKGQDVQAPRSQDVSKAGKLVREAEQACKKGNDRVWRSALADQQTSS